MKRENGCFGKRKSKRNRKVIIIYYNYIIIINNSFLRKKKNNNERKEKERKKYTYNILFYFSLFLFIFFLSLPLQPTATPPSLFFLLFSFSNQLHHRLPPTPNVKQILSYRRITVRPSHSGSVTPCMFRFELFGYLLHRSVSVRI